MPSMKFDLVLTTNEDKKVSMAYTSKAKAIEYGQAFIDSPEGVDVVAARVVRKSDGEDVHEFDIAARKPAEEPKQEFVTGFNRDDKLRLTIVGGKFKPVVTFKAFLLEKDEDGKKVHILESHDLEYDRVRRTPVDQIEKIEVKVGARYLEYREQEKGR